MDRRVISRILLGSMAGATVLGERATAQEGVAAPRWPRTREERQAGAVPVDYSIPSHEVCGFAIVERYGLADQPCPRGSPFGASCSPAQVAVNVAAKARCNVGVLTPCYLSRPVHIDRPVDSEQSYLRVVGLGEKAGFRAAQNTKLFSSTRAFKDAPVTEMVRFENVNFEAKPALDAYVLDDAKYLRTSFSGCNFVGIKCLSAISVHTQSIYFEDCNIRAWKGIFFNGAGAANYDIKFTNCLMEAGEAGVVLRNAVGCRFVTHTHEGSKFHAAIKVIGSQGLYVQGYFEANRVDLDLSEGAHLGACVQSSYFVGTTSPGKAENVLWGVAEACVSIGNYSDWKLHNLGSASKVTIRDYAVARVTNRAGQSELPHNVPVVDAVMDKDQPVPSAEFRKCVLDNECIDTNSNFSKSRFTASVAGYYSFNCKMNAKAVTGTLTRGVVSIFKNGAEFQRLVDVPLSVPTRRSAILCGVAELFLDIDDYVEMFGFLVCTGSAAFGFDSVAEATRFSGKYVRSPDV